MYLYTHRFKCCNQKSQNCDAAKLIPGCKKGKHCSEHHENYTYAAYTTFMMDTVRLASVRIETGLFVQTTVNIDHCKQNLHP